MRLRLAFALTVLGSVAIAAEPSLVFVDRTKPVEVCGLKAASLDLVANALVEHGGVREAAGNEKFLAYEQLDFTHIWTFTRLGHTAHPAVICRELKDGSTGLQVSMHFVCGGNRLACESLFGEFLDLNERMKANAKRPPL